MDFSKDFFKYLPDIHESDSKEYKTIMLDILSTVENAQQLFNQVNKLMEQDYFPYLRFIELDEYIYKSQEENYDAPTEFFEILSMGKCLETFFFPFFEKLIKEKFQQYRISSVIMLNRL